MINAFLLLKSAELSYQLWRYRTESKCKQPLLSDICYYLNLSYFMYFGAKYINLAILEDFNVKPNSFKTLAFQRVWLVIVNRNYLHSPISFKITESYVNKNWQKFQKTIRNCQLDSIFDDCRSQFHCKILVLHVK